METKGNRDFINRREAGKIPVYTLQATRSKSPVKARHTLGEPAGSVFHPLPGANTERELQHKMSTEDEPFDEFEAAHPDMAA